MADIQFDINLDLVEKYVPAENVTVVQEDYQSVKFVYTILNREQPVDLSGATDIVVSFVKPDGHIVLQNDGTLVNGKIELVANPQAFTYVGKTYFQIQYKIGTSIYNTRQAFLWVERGSTSCQTLSSTDFAPMLDQAIQAGQMLSGIDLQALIDSKVTAENAQADVDALELRVGALEVTIVGLDSRVDALEASQAIQDGKITTLETGLASVESNLSGLTSRVTANETAISGLQTSQVTQDTKITALETGQANLSSRVTSVEGNITTVVSEVDALQLTAVDHETRIDGLEANMPNLDPINTAITTLQAKDVEQDGRIGANEIAISAVQTKNTQQDTAIAGNATEIGNLQAEQTTQNNRLTAVENKNATQDSAIGDIQAKDTAQDAAISSLQSSQATQDTDIASIKVKNTEQDTAISANATSIVAVDTKVDANKTAQDTVNSGVAGSLSNHTTRIDALEADATVDDARITNLEGDNTSNKNRIATIEGAIGVLNSDINDLQGNDAVQDSRLNDIETKNANQDTAISGNTASITANKADADSKITGLTTRLGTAEADIANLKTKDTQQDIRITAIENKDATQDNRMTAIETKNTQQDTTINKVTNNQIVDIKHYQQKIRANNVAKLSKFEFPINFSWKAPIDIFTDGKNFKTFFDVSKFKNTGGVTYYIKYDIGSNANNGTSENTPFQTLSKAIQVSNDGDTIVVLDEILSRTTMSMSNISITKNINIIAKNKCVIKSGDTQVFTKTPGYENVYETTRSGAIRVVDYKKLYDFVQVNNVGECNSIPGTWFSDGTKVFIHTLESTAPIDSNHFILINVGAFFTVNAVSRDVNFYMENLDIIGGFPTVETKNSTTSTPSIYLKNTNLLFNCSTIQGALYAAGCKHCFSQNVTCAYSWEDGFDYQPLSGIATNFIEVDCRGHSNGRLNQSADNFNGSTAHENCKGVRVGGQYYRNIGPQVVDIYGTVQSLNFNVLVFDGASTQIVKIGFEVMDNEMWLYNCTSFGNDLDIYAPTGTMYVDNNSVYYVKGGNITEIS